MTHFDDVRRSSAADTWPGPVGERITLTDGDLTAVIVPADGCRLLSLRVAGHELMRPWTTERRAFQYGSFPMVPWLGRLDRGRLVHAGTTHLLPVNKPPHALHGMACFGPWTHQGDGVFTYRLGEPWPWTGTVTQTFALADGALTTTLTVATDGRPFPAAAGWHPWFRTDVAGAALSIDTHPDWQEEPGEDELPTGRRVDPRPGPWDDCFGFDGPMSATLTWPGVAELAMSSDASYMTLFTALPDAACVEPSTGPPNGVNTLPRLTTVDTPVSICTTWRLRALG